MSLTLPARTVLSDLPADERGPIYAALDTDLRAVAVAAVDHGVEVVIMANNPESVMVTIARDGHLNDGPEVAVEHEYGHDDAGEYTRTGRLTVHTTPGDYYDVTMRQMQPAAATLLVVGILIGWGRMS